jgi:diaminopimelate epimerase
MRRKLVLEFTKMHGAGNDFIVVDNRFYHFSDGELSALARQWCPRRLGVGADGLLALAPPRKPAHQYRMRYFNADGSLGTMCGNGARCLARFARAAGLEAEEMTFETEAGVFRALVPALPDAPVRLFYVDPPRDWKPRVVLEEAEAGRIGPVHYLWTGTEHAIRFVEDVAGAPVAAWGPLVRRDPALAPAGANVNFVQVVRPGGDGEAAALRVRTYEKGVEAETLACGTGALASAVSARLLGHIGSEVVEVDMPGGLLRVGFDLEGETVSGLYLEGPVVFVFRGTLEV